MALAKLKIKKGDKVVVIAGKDKGKSGEVIAVSPKDSRVRVSGVALARRHTKPSYAGAGGVIEKELFIHVSNVALADPKSGKPSKIGYKTLKDGRKARFAKASGEVVDN